MARRKKRRGPSSRDLAELRSGKASASDRREAGMRKLRQPPSRHRGKRAR